MRLEGKVALVTGGSQGIGRGIALRFAREGADIVIADVKDDKADGVRDEIQALGRRALFVKADLRSVAEIRSLFGAAAGHFGRVDILINNAGVEFNSPFLDVDESHFDTVIGVNLKGVFFASQAFARQLIDAKRAGKIINISSVHEEIPFPGFASYCASKGGVRMLTRDLAIELGPHSINVNAIAPGAIETPINRSLLEDKPRLEKLLAKIPLGRLGKPEDVAGVAAFLASSDADYVTGSTYFIDGGVTWDYHE